MRWGVLLLFGLVALSATAGTALAQPSVSLEPAPDGSVVLVGSGWRPEQQLLISVGQDLFEAHADSVGDFEVPTTLVATGTPLGPVAVHRYEPPTFAMTRLGLESAETYAADPYAVLFAQSLLMGAGLLTAGASALGLATYATSKLRGRPHRYS